MLIEYEDVDDILKIFDRDNGRLVRHIVENLDFGIRNKVKLLPLFELKNTNTENLLVICLPEKNYRRTLNYAKQWAIDLEEFESAAKTVELLNRMPVKKK